MSINIVNSWHFYILFFQVCFRRYGPGGSLEHPDLQSFAISVCLSVTLIYLLTPWSRVIIEKLTSSQLVKKFPEFYGTRRFITAFTSARHLSLS
jgi:hypothetical protein